MIQLMILLLCSKVITLSRFHYMICCLGKDHWPSFTILLPVLHIRLITKMLKFDGVGFVLNFQIAVSPGTTCVPFWSPPRPSSASLSSSFSTKLFRIEEGIPSLQIKCLSSDETWIWKVTSWIHSNYNFRFTVRYCLMGSLWAELYPTSVLINLIPDLENRIW